MLTCNVERMAGEGKRGCGGSEIGVELGSALAPIGEQLGMLPGVGREQAGDPSRHGVAPALAQIFFVARGEVAEVRGQRRAPGLVEAFVDDLEQRPDHGVRPEFEGGAERCERLRGHDHRLRLR